MPLVFFCFAYKIIVVIIIHAMDGDVGIDDRTHLFF